MGTTLGATPDAPIPQADYQSASHQITTCIYRLFPSMLQACRVQPGGGRLIRRTAISHNGSYRTERRGVIQLFIEHSNDTHRRPAEIRNRRPYHPPPRPAPLHRKDPDFHRPRPLLCQRRKVGRLGRVEGRFLSRSLAYIYIWLHSLLCQLSSVRQCGGRVEPVGRVDREARPLPGAATPTRPPPCCDPCRLQP